MNNKIKRERGPNWDPAEKIIFFNCLKKYKSEIENSKKDFFANQKRNAAWEMLLNEFNSYANVQKREIKSLKKFWETEKAKSRKSFTTERKSRLATGGGSFEEQPLCQDPDVEELIDRPHIVEWVNMFDSDGVALIHSNESVMNNGGFMEPNQITDETPVEIIKSPQTSSTTRVIDGTPAVEPVEEPCFVFNTTRNNTSAKSKSNIKENKKNEGILKECELRVKRQKIALDHEEKMNKLQILNQKLVMQSIVAKRLEENRLYKLQCQKIALQIKKLKEEN